jgi:ribosomal protein S18 acetylase RimI-like enzyme
MAHLEARTLTSNDFVTLQAMERDIFGSVGEEILCSYYLRLCTDFFSRTCFLVFADGEPAGYLLGFMRDNEAYCTTLAVYPKYRRTRVITMLIGAFMRAIIDHVDSAKFTVKPDNIEARALHRMLGAVEVETRQDFYGPGDERIVSMIDRATFERMRPKYERIGILDRTERSNDRSERIDLRVDRSERIDLRADRSERSEPVSTRHTATSDAVPEALDQMAAE